MATEKNLRVCKNGHKYYKSTTCPTCPVCEKQRAKESGLFSGLSAPAQRALQNNGIKSLTQLAQYTEKEVLQLHGIGPSSIPKLKQLLKNQKLSFKAP